MHVSASELVEKRIKIIDHLIDAINGKAIFLQAAQVDPRSIQHWISKDASTFSITVSRYMLLGLTLGNVIADAEHYALATSTIVNSSSDVNTLDNTRVPNGLSTFAFLSKLPSYRAFGDIRPWALFSLTRALREFEHYTYHNYARLYNNHLITVSQQSSNNVFGAKKKPSHTSSSYQTRLQGGSRSRVMSYETTSTHTGFVSPSDRLIPRSHAMGPSLTLLTPRSFNKPLKSSKKQERLHKAPCNNSLSTIGPDAIDLSSRAQLNLQEGFDLYGGETILQPNPVCSPSYRASILAAIPNPNDLAFEIVPMTCSSPLTASTVPQPNLSSEHSLTSSPLSTHDLSLAVTTTDQMGKSPVNPSSPSIHDSQTSQASRTSQEPHKSRGAGRGTGANVGAQILSNELFGNALLPHEKLAGTPDLWALGTVLGESDMSIIRSGAIRLSGEVMTTATLLNDELNLSMNARINGDVASTLITNPAGGGIGIGNRVSLVSGPNGLINANSNTNISGASFESTTINNGNVNTTRNISISSSTSTSSPASPTPFGAGATSGSEIGANIGNNPGVSGSASAYASSGSSSFINVWGRGEAYKYVLPTGLAFSMPLTTSVDVCVVLKDLLECTKVCYRLLLSSIPLEETLFTEDAAGYTYVDDECIDEFREDGLEYYNYGQSRGEKTVDKAAEVGEKGRFRKRLFFGDSVAKPSKVISHAVKQAVSWVDAALMQHILVDITKLIKGLAKSQMKIKMESLKRDHASRRYDQDDLQIHSV